VPPVGPAVFIGAAQFKLEQAFGALGIPAPALAFEAAVDDRFDTLLYGTAAAFDGGDAAPGNAAQGGGGGYKEMLKPET